ncbi:hypothetical protein HK104_002043 [Borealophlyctis nickersoniae]|nr:hypothetical protein HK104_002043 [Borealophlyctis nickersoniae]
MESPTKADKAVEPITPQKPGNDDKDEPSISQKTESPAKPDETTEPVVDGKGWDQGPSRETYADDVWDPSAYANWEDSTGAAGDAYYGEEYAIEPDYGDGEYADYGDEYNVAEGGEYQGQEATPAAVAEKSDESATAAPPSATGDAPTTDSAPVDTLDATVSSSNASPLKQKESADDKNDKTGNGDKRQNGAVSDAVTDNRSWNGRRGGFGAGRGGSMSRTGNFQGRPSGHVTQR